MTSQPDPAAAPRAAAFFDLDRTLVAGSSGFAIAIEMTRAGIVSRRALLRDSFLAARFRLWSVDDATTETVRARVSGYITDLEVDRVMAVSQQVLDRVLPRVQPAVLARARAHHARGEPVFLITASGQEFAELIGHALEFDGAVGSRSEVVGGRYTGRAGGPFVYGEVKVQEMRRLAAEHGLDLQASTAYSDSISDLPMLRAVGRAVAVNPDKALREVAVAEGWEVLALDRLGQRLRTIGAVLAALPAAWLARRALTARRRAASGK